MDWNRSRSGGDEVRHARGGCGRETQRQNVVGVDVCSSVPFRQGAIVLVPVKDAIAATAVVKRPSLTGPARGGVAGRQVGTKGWPTLSNKGMDLGHVHNPGYVPQPTQNPAKSTYNVEEAKNYDGSALR